MYIGVFAVLGVILLAASFAKVPTAHFEAESGTLANVTKKPDTAASGGNYIQFANGSTVSAAFPGDPRPSKKIYWGAGIHGNGDPARHEDPTGKSLSIRRTFFQWSAHDTPPNDGLYNTVRSDHANNRLPWVSTKTPPWNEVGAGLHDAAIDRLLRELDSYGKPVWLTFHHEPEGGGGVNSPDDPSGAAGWRSMQTRVRQRMNALGTKNIAFAPILMSWTWDSRSGRNPNDWWVPGIWNLYGIDHYNDSISGSMLGNLMNTVDAYFEAKNMPIAFGEWGNRGEDAQAAQEMQDFWEWGFSNNVVGYCYFDSNLNSATGGWELFGEPLNKFRDIMKNDTRVQRINSL